MPWSDKTFFNKPQTEIRNVSKMDYKIGFCFINVFMQINVMLICTS